jgi:ABC-type uncharacterized transport system permease subunit
MGSVLTIVSIITILVPVRARRVAQKNNAVGGIAAHRNWEWVAVALIALGLLFMGFQSEVLPMFTVQGGLRTLALFVALGWLVLRRKERMAAAGMILLPMAALLLLSSLVEPPHTVASPVGSPFFTTHVALVFLGLGGFALSFALSTLFLVQRRRLKRKDFNDIGQLPSMETLDRLNFRTQCVGFAALTAGVAMGVFLLTQSSGTRGIDDITVWGTCAVWLWYAAGLHARVVLGWRGRTAAVFGVVGFGSLGVVLTVVTALFGGWHGS